MKNIIIIDLKCQIGKGETEERGGKAKAKTVSGDQDDSNQEGDGGSNPVVLGMIGRIHTSISTIPPVLISLGIIQRIK